MSKVDPIPNQDILRQRRIPDDKWIINPKDVSAKDDIRVRKWGLEVMKKHESKLIWSKYKNKQIVYKGDITAEDIDIKNLYPFKDLNWIIFKDGQFWSLMLLSKGKLLALLTYSKI